MDDYIYSQDMFADDHDPLGVNDVGLDTIFSTSYENNFAATQPFSQEFRIMSGSSVPPVPELNESDLELSPSFLAQFVDSDNSVKLEVIHPAQLSVTSGRNDILPANEVNEAVAGSPKAICYIDDPASISRVQTLIPNEETVTFENWPGSYNFKATPVIMADKTTKKKVVYSEEQNKLFCNTSTAVPFKLEVDYDNIDDLGQYMVRTCLVYEDNDVLNKAVFRCISCVAQEKNLTDIDKAERLDHMIRPHNPNCDIKYYQNPISKRCYLLSGLKHPEPGMTYSINTYCFSCRNSCSVPGIEGKTRRAMSIMFYLFDLRSGAVVGRSHTHVRICSAPIRDYNKEINPGNGAANRKRKSTDVETDVRLPSPKQLNLGSGVVEMSSNIRDDVTRRAMVVQSQHPEHAIRNVVRAAAPGKSDEDVSSSQETVYSCEESESRIQLRDLVKDIRWVLKLKHSADPASKAYSQHMFHTLRLVQDLCKQARNVDTERRAKEQGRSPDGGFHDNGGD